MILFWTPGGMPLLLHIEGAIAKALMHREQNVHAVLCDGSYRACILREIQQNIPASNWSASCAACVKNTSQTLDRMGIPYSYIGDFVSIPTREYIWRNTEAISWDNLDGLQYENVPIGKNIQSAIIRYLQGCPLTGNEEVVREYAFSACMSAEAAKNAYSKLKVDKIVMSHGVYAEWGPALQTAWNLRIPVIAWMGSYLRCRFYFRQIEDNIRLDFHNMSREAWNACRQMDFSAEKEARLHKYQVDRYQKHISFDMKRFKEYSGQTESLRRKYAPLSNKPVWGIMAHINWDTVSDYSPMAYPSFDEWIKDTIKEISDITTVQWLVKVHPAESWDNPASGVQKLIEHNFPRLPAHIKVISAEEQISPLDFLNMIDGGITVYGTGGLELALQGKPVILADESHYGGKGFTYDGLTTESYKQLLHKAGTLPQLNAEQLLLTKKYAYFYFIQRQIPVSVVMDPATDWWCFQEQKAHILLPGKDPFIDFLCDRIFDGQDFIMPENLVLQADKIDASESDAKTSGAVEAVQSKQLEVIQLIKQVSDLIDGKKLQSAYANILRLLTDYSSNIDASLLCELQNMATLVKANLEYTVQSVSASSLVGCKNKNNSTPVRGLPKVSVIIPSYNRANMIGITLESFVNQDYPKDHYEIIVADNNSTDATKTVVMKWQAESAVQIEYLFEQRQGVHYARNSAAKLAKGDILYFTDDDMIADRNLLSEIVKVFEIDWQIGAATGRVLPKWECPPPDWILKLCYNAYLSIFDELGDALAVYDHDFGVYSCHQAIWREAFFRAGGFNPESTVTDYIGDEETGLNIKLKKLGYKFGYSGKSLIYHMIPKARMTQDYLNKRLANQGYADCYTEYREYRYSPQQLNDRIAWYGQNIMKRNEDMIQKKLAGNVRGGWIKLTLIIIFAELNTIHAFFMTKALKKWFLLITGSTNHLEINYAGHFKQPDYAVFGPE